jgi:hypothetical protein
MSQKAITINTASETPAHITADDDAYIYNAILGGQSGILSGLSCTKVNDNTVVLSDGGFSNQGYIVRIEKGDTESFTVDTGSQGVSRIDTIISEFSRNAAGEFDTHQLKLIKGTPSVSPTAPALTSQSIDGGGVLSQLPLYHIRIDGISITSITAAAQTVTQANEGAVTVFVQENEPSSAAVGDLWIW